jgi:hypothetical protein
MTIGFTGLAALVSFAAGAVASVVGFGIGSLLTTVVAGGLLLPYLKR